MGGPRGKLAKAFLLVAGLAILLAAPSTAGADSPSGTLTITGSLGRDDLAVRIIPINDSISRLTIEPAANVTATSGSCPPQTDPVTGRPVRHECTFGAGQLTAVVINLQGGDDAIDYSDRDSRGPSVTASGGLGNDLIDVEAPIERTLRGNDGDDELRAPGRAAPKGGPGGGTVPGVIFDGGAGRDLAAFAGAVTTTGVGLGVSTDLKLGKASMIGPDPQTGQPATVRTDSLIAIERISGTGQGDILGGGEGPDELFGLGGPDNLRGEIGADRLDGGAGSDDLVGGADSDILDGGTGIDTYPVGGGKDTFITRDGFLESVTCAGGDIVFNDLVDKVVSPANCASIDTAQAKHKVDTAIPRRALRIGADGVLRVGVVCPLRKPTNCVGTLRAFLKHQALAGARYRLHPGQRARLPLRLSEAEAARVRGKGITLAASEVDADARTRRVLRRVTVR